MSSKSKTLESAKTGDTKCMPLPDLIKDTPKSEFRKTLKEMLENPDFDEMAFQDALRQYQESLYSADKHLPFDVAVNLFENVTMSEEQRQQKMNDALRKYDDVITADIQAVMQEFAEEHGYPITMDESGIGGVNINNIDDFLRDCDRTDFTKCGDAAKEAAEEREKFGKPMSSEEFQQKIVDALSADPFDKTTFDEMIAEQQKRLNEKASMEPPCRLGDFPSVNGLIKNAEGKADDMIYRHYPLYDTPLTGIDSIDAMSNGTNAQINADIQAALKTYAIDNNIPYSMGENGISSVNVNNISDFIAYGNRDDFSKCTPIVYPEPTVEPGPVCPPSDPEPVPPEPIPDEHNGYTQEDGKLKSLWETVTSNPAIKAVADKIKEIASSIKEWAKNTLVVERGSKAALELGEFDDDTPSAPDSADDLTV